MAKREDSFNPDSWSQTCWRDLALEHPADWEMTLASPLEDPAGFTFSDRWYERLKLKRRPMKGRPNVRKLLEQKREKDADKTEPMQGQPEGWFGKVQRAGEGRIVHAGRYFDDQKAMVEAILIWPDRRQVEVENRILSSIRLADGEGGAARWEAMGLRVRLARAFDLLKFETDVGRITWTFGTKKGQRKNPPLFVRRLGIPKYWLGLPLEEWLEMELEAGRTTVEKRRFLFNGHPAAKLVSAATSHGLSRLAGKEAMRVDVAWRCPVEERVYLVRYAQQMKRGLLDLPPHFEIDCCKPYAFWGNNPGDRRPGKRVNVISAADILDAVPVVNRASKVERKSRGGVLVEVPMRRPRYMVPPISWVFPFSRSRRVELDALGATILGLCDGRRTAYEIMERFGSDNRLTFREAHLSVMAFLRRLSERGVLAIAKWEDAKTT